jgi:hypothetical protein
MQSLGRSDGHPLPFIRQDDEDSDSDSKSAAGPVALHVRRERQTANPHSFEAYKLTRDTAEQRVSMASRALDSARTASDQADHAAAAHHRWDVPRRCLASRATLLLGTAASLAGVFATTLGGVFLQQGEQACAAPGGACFDPLPVLVSGAVVLAGGLATLTVSACAAEAPPWELRLHPETGLTNQQMTRREALRQAGEARDLQKLALAARNAVVHLHDEYAFPADVALLVAAYLDEGTGRDRQYPHGAGRSLGQFVHGQIVLQDM